MVNQSKQEPIFFLPYRDVSETFFPDFNKFDVNHFLNEKNDKLAFLSFGVGVRSCPGQYLAMMELKSALSQFILSLKLSLPPGKEKKSLGMTMSINARPSEPVLLCFEQRK